MARLARLVLPGIPYHVTQRGDRRQKTFFQDSDYELYRGRLTNPSINLTGIFNLTDWVPRPSGCCMAARFVAHLHAVS